MQKVKVVSVEDAGFYTSKNASGSTVKVTLQRGNDFATCDGILIWEDELADSDTFDEWVAYAVAGETGYSAVIVEGEYTVLYDCVA